MADVDDPLYRVGRMSWRLREYASYTGMHVSDNVASILGLLAFLKRITGRCGTMISNDYRFKLDNGERGLVEVRKTIT